MNPTSSQIFVEEEADGYFERNLHARGMIADYLLSLFAPKDLFSFDVAEFGIGGGQNLMLFKNYVRTVHGFDASERAISCFQSFFANRPDAADFSATQVNVCEPFSTSCQFNLIFYGFFAYYADDSELDIVKRNALAMLKPAGYLFVHDFLSRAGAIAPDSRNPRLLVHKRPLPFWIQHFAEFDLIDFRLFDERKGRSDRFRIEHQTVDLVLPDDDHYWTFGALFRRRKAS